jgi:hypothetical protein
MTRKNLPIALYLLLVFGSGAVVGALGYRTYNPPTARSGSLNASRRRASGDGSMSMRAVPGLTSRTTRLRS